MTEGHVLLVGGDDANPVVRVLVPSTGSGAGLREVITLTGHTKVRRILYVSYDYIWLIYLLPV